MAGFGGGYQVQVASIGDADHSITQILPSLVICQKELNCLQQNIKYTDINFPLDDSDVNQRIGSWLRPHEIQFDNPGGSRQWKLFDNPKSSDLSQGTLDDCWLINSMAAIAEKPFLLDRIFVTKQFSEAGIYALQLHHEGEWKEIVIDDQLPCSADGHLLFGKAKRNQLWPCLLEKAVAKLLGGYSKVPGYSMNAGLRLLSGCAVELIFTVDQLFKERGRERLFKKLELVQEEGFLLACETGQSPFHSFFQLMSNHAYSFLSFCRVNNTPLFLLRNVWGSTPFNGAWSEGSAEWNDVPEEMIPPEGKGDAADGVFWISVDDFCSHFHSLSVCYVREDYHECFFKGKLFQFNDPHWDAYEIEVEENTLIDLNLQTVIAKMSDYNYTEVGLFIFDQENGLVGATEEEDLSTLKWKSHLLSKGTYRVYLMALPKLMPKDNTPTASDQPSTSTAVVADQSNTHSLESLEFYFVCHSSREVKVTNLHADPNDMSKILLLIAMSEGDEYELSDRPGDITGHILSKGYLSAVVIAVVNRSKTNAYKVLTEPRDPPQPENRVYSTRSNDCDKTEDLIPPNNSQIVQMFVLDNFTYEHDEGTNMRVVAQDFPFRDLLLHAFYQNPLLTASNRPIHQLVYNELIRSVRFPRQEDS